MAQVARRLMMVDAFRTDLRYAARSLAKSPSFTAAAVLTLAVGIGATTAVFSVIDAVILRPLTYQDPDRLYVIHEVLPQMKTPIVPVNALHFREWRSGTRSFEEMALLAGLDVNVTGLGEPERIHAARVSPSLFPMLGAHAQLGRTFLEEEDQPGRDLVVVLGDELWKSRFARDRQIVGRTIALDGEPHTIIGVLSADFTLPKLKYLSERPSVAERPQLWKPFALWNNESILAQLFGFACIARVKVGVSRSQALAELNAIQANLALRAPQKSQFQAALIPLQDQIIGRSRNGLHLMLAAVVMVLVTGCVNIAHLLFARGNARRREMAVRQAAGATKGRLIWQILVENLLVSIIGGLLGIVAAYNAVRLIRTYAAVDVPRLDEAVLNSRVLLFTLATSIAAGVLSGLLPAWQLAKTDLLESIKSGSITVSTSRKAGRLRWLLVSLEVGVSTVCLIAGGLLLHSFVNVLDVDRGFKEEQAVSVQLNLTHTRYQDAARRVGLVDELLQRMRSLPGVISAGSASRVPLSGQVGGSVLTVEGTSLPRLERPIVAIVVTDPGYFRTIGIPFQAGRGFEDADRNGRRVAVVAASVAERVWPGRNPVGQQFRLGPDQAPLIEVVGVAGSIRGVSLTESPTLDVYLPYWQSDMSLYSDQISLVLRTATDAQGTFVPIRNAIREIDPELPMSALRTMEDVVKESVAPRRFQMSLVLLLAVTAMLLVALGIYSVVSDSVAQRTKEMGIRMALGAQISNIFRMVLHQGLLPVGIGLAAGVIASIALGRILRGLLFGVAPTDVTTFVAVSLLVGVVALVASFIPARRATRVDPVVALRYE